MAENNTSAQYSADVTSDFDNYKNEEYRQIMSQQYQILILTHHIVKFLLWDLVMFPVIILTLGRPIW